MSRAGQAYAWENARLAFLPLMVDTREVFVF